MGKKRKSDAARLDEVDRHMYTSFCNAANSLSQLYSHAVNHQKLSFQAGERHALEKLYQWILQQEEKRSRVTHVDIQAYIQNEIECELEDPPVSPRVPSDQNSQVNLHLINLTVAVPSAATIEQGGCGSQVDQQSKKAVFSNALSTSVCHSLQNLTTEPSYNVSSSLSTGNTNSPNQQNSIGKDPPTSSDSMDMHAD